MQNRYQSPLVKQDLARLDKSPEVRRSALLSLRACVEQLDQSSMPRFLAQVSDARECRSHAISLYEDVARVHGRLIAPHIPRIMATVVRSLSSSGSSIHLQEACSKVAASILRYAVSPETPSSTLGAIFQGLCSPLIDSLLSKLEPLAAGAALCLQALVESEKWKYAPKHVVEEVCAKSSAVLKDRAGQTVAHMQLARSVARTGAPINRIDMVRAAKEMLLQGTASWQNRAAALQLLRTAVASLDDKESVAAEVASLEQIIEQLRLDRMPLVRKEAVKAAHALRVLVSGEAAATTTTTTTTIDSSQQLVFSCSSPMSSSSSTRVSRNNGRLLRYTTTSSSSGSDAGDEIWGRSNGSLKETVNRYKRQKEEALNKYTWKKESRSTDDEELMDNCRITGEEATLGEEESMKKYRIIAEDQIMNRYRSTSDELQEEAEVEALTTWTPPPKSCSDSSPQAKSVLSAEDFVRFTTPRTLVRSLQSQSPAVIRSEECGGDDATSVDGGGGGGDEDMEVHSETEWSVRDNPIAQDSDDDDVRAASAKEEDEPKAEEEEPKEAGPMEASPTKKRIIMEEVQDDETCSSSSLWIVERMLGGCAFVILLLLLAMMVMRLVFNQGQEADLYVDLVPT